MIVLLLFALWQTPIAVPKVLVVLDISILSTHKIVVYWHVLDTLKLPLTWHD